MMRMQCYALRTRSSSYETNARRNLVRAPFSSWRARSRVNPMIRPR